MRASTERFLKWLFLRTISKSSTAMTLTISGITKKTKSICSSSSSSTLIKLQLEAGVSEDVKSLSKEDLNKQLHDFHETYENDPKRRLDGPHFVIDISLRIVVVPGFEKLVILHVCPFCGKGSSNIPSGTHTVESISLCR